MKTERKILLLLVIPLFFGGVTLLTAAHFINRDALFHDIFRDLGIAFLLSALVTIAYETYAKTRFDLAKIESLLDTVYGSGVPQPIWDSIKETLLKRDVMRCNTVLHLRVIRDASIGEHDVLLDVDLAYDLANLLSKEREHTVVHALDYHIARSQFPRFVEASIGNQSETIPNSQAWRSNNGEINLEAGRLSLNLRLRSSKEKKPIPLRVRRHEFRQCPGSYYLIVSEITDGARIYLDECAEDVSLTVFFYPAGREIDLTRNHVAIIDEPLLPGHCLEFKILDRRPDQIT